MLINVKSWWTIDRGPIFRAIGINCTLAQRLYEQFEKVQAECLYCVRLNDPITGSPSFFHPVEVWRSLSAFSPAKASAGEPAIPDLGTYPQQLRESDDSRKWPQRSGVTNRMMLPTGSKLMAHREGTLTAS